jgi:tRNA-dihydrouridine synthase
MVERAGAYVLAVHGRTREQRDLTATRADWAQIRAVKQVGIFFCGTAAGAPAAQAAVCMAPQFWACCMVFTVPCVAVPCLYL